MKWLSPRRPAPRPSRRAVVVGAGPGGLLATIHLLRREGYHVTLVDPGRDYGAVADLSSHRSWMIGLAQHGLNAIREVPGLFEYVEAIGIPLERFSVFLGAREIWGVQVDASQQHAKDPAEREFESYFVDRNYIVAALARYLRDHHGKDGDRYQPRYGTRLLYVDHAQRRVLVRDEASGKEEYVPYELLVGADGIRSVVRGAMLVNHREFECRVDDIFSHFKAVRSQEPRRCTCVWRSAGHRDWGAGGAPMGRWERDPETPIQPLSTGARFPCLPLGARAPPAGAAGGPDDAAPAVYA